MARLAIAALALILGLGACSDLEIRVRQEVDITRKVDRPGEGGEDGGEQEAPDRSEGRRRNGVGSAAPNR